VAGPTIFSVPRDFEEEEEDAADDNHHSAALQTPCDGIRLTQNPLDKALEQGKLEKVRQGG
jgi:hypothetical protein